MRVTELTGIGSEYSTLYILYKYLVLVRGITRGRCLKAFFKPSIHFPLLFKASRKMTKKWRMKGANIQRTVRRAHTGWIRPRKYAVTPSVTMSTPLRTTLNTKN